MTDTEWEDIGSAPKDGTPILVAMNGVVYRGRWWGGLTFLIDGYAVGFEPHKLSGWRPLPPPPDGGE